MGIRIAGEQVTLTTILRQGKDGSVRIQLRCAIIPDTTLSRTPLRIVFTRRSILRFKISFVPISDKSVDINNRKRKLRAGEWADKPTEKLTSKERERETEGPQGLMLIKNKL